MEKNKKPLDWEKISANDMTDKGLISKIHYTNSSYSSILNNPIKRWTENLNRHFSKEDIQMAQQAHEKMLNIAIIREMQIKTTMRYHLTSVRMVILKNLQTIKSSGF